MNHVVEELQRVCCAGEGPSVTERDQERVPRQLAVDARLDGQGGTGRVAVCGWDAVPRCACDGRIPPKLWPCSVAAAFQQARPPTLPALSHRLACHLCSRGSSYSLYVCRCSPTAALPAPGFRL